MEERIQKILEIQVDVNDAIKGINSLNGAIAEQRELQKRLKAEIDELSKAEGDNTDSINELREAYILSQQKVKDYNTQINGLSRTVQNQLRLDREQVGSMQALRAQLSNLTKAYDELSAEERESAKGKELKDKINDVTDALKGAEEETQRYYRNVGNYENAIKNSIGLNGKFGQTMQNVADATSNGVGPALKEATAGLKGVGAQLLKLLANPIVAILAAVAAALMAVVNGIKSSEQNMAKFKAVTAAFQPILDVITRAFQGLASVILDVVGWIGKGVGAFSRLLERLPFVGDEIKKINDESARYVQLEKDKQALIERNRKLTVDAAKAERDVAELRTKAKDRENYTDEERLKFVQEANAIEKRISEEKKAAAEENLRLLQEQAAATENTKEINDELAAAEAEVFRAETEYNNKVRELLEQENTIKNEIAADDKARAEANRKQMEEKIELQKEYNDALEEAYQETQDMLIELLQEGVVKEEELERTRYERQVQAIKDKQALYAQDTELYQEYALQLELAEEQHQMNMQRISMEARMAEAEAAEQAFEEEKERQQELYEKEVELQNLKLAAYSSIAGSISSILEATAGDNKKRLKAAKVAALGEVMLNQGIAIAQAVKAGGEYPFPMNLLTIASSVAGAIAALVPAIQAVNSVKLARGGRVSGAGTSTSDSIPAMLSNGEFVVNARATSMFPELLESINNLGLGIAAPARVERINNVRQQQAQGSDLINALRQMPAPVVSVKEITRVSNRVQTLENISKLS